MSKRVSTTHFYKLYTFYNSQKHLDDQYLFLMVAVIVAPILVVLIVQVAAFPLTLHTKVINEVSTQLLSIIYNIHSYRMIIQQQKCTWTVVENMR